MTDVLRIGTNAFIGLVSSIAYITIPFSALATPPPLPTPRSPLPSSPIPLAQTPAEQLDLDPEIIEDSPVLQRWLEEIPDVRADIRHDPSFRTRLRLGYANFPSTDDASGIAIAIEDIFVGQTGLTVNADYQTAFERDRDAYGANLRYYILPLGNRVNVAPTVGYRSVETEEYATDGVDLGVRLLLVPSRTGAADIAFTQTWVIPTSTAETVSLSTLTFAYAVSDRLRLATDLQLQHTDTATDSRVGVGLEWMF